VATKEEYIARYRSQLLAITPELKKKAGIVQEGGIWYFDDANGVDSWPKIAGKSLGSFPNAAFIKKYIIEN
jgi:phage pi2 protein 07